LKRAWWDFGRLSNWMKRNSIERGSNLEIVIERLTFGGAGMERLPDGKVCLSLVI
jgi:hypothetical protein